MDSWMNGLPTITGTIYETGEKVKMICNGYWIGSKGRHISSYVRADGKNPEYQYSMNRKHIFFLEAIN